MYCASDIARVANPLNSVVTSGSDVAATRANDAFNASPLEPSSSMPFAAASFVSSSKPPSRGGAWRRRSARDGMRGASFAPPRYSPKSSLGDDAHHRHFIFL